MRARPTHPAPDVLAPAPAEGLDGDDDELLAGLGIPASERAGYLDALRRLAEDVVATYINETLHDPVRDLHPREQRAPGQGGERGVEPGAAL